MTTPNEIQTRLADGTAQLLDVRSVDEWNELHAANATHLSLQDLQAGTLPAVDTTVKLYLYCQTGIRAARARGILARAGYEVESIGGIIDWQAAGGEVL